MNLATNLKQWEWLRRLQATVTELPLQGFTQDGDGMFDGVYVYEGSAPTVLQGDEVTVSGTVSEYYSLLSFKILL